MNPQPPSSELRCLVDQLLDGRALSKTESARLEEILEDDDALAFYVEVMQQDTLLPHALSTLPRAMKQPVVSLWDRPGLRIGAMAALVALAFVAGIFIGRPSRVAPVASPAAHDLPVRLTGLVGVEWEPDFEPGAFSEDGKSRRFAIHTGLAELTYGNGVRVTVEGPSEFLVTGANSAKLTRGRVVAAVPKGAEGFQIDYKGGRVVDLGTEFGLETSLSGRTEVGVFDGKVELHRPDRDVLSLTENQALLLNESGANEVSGVPLDRDKFVRRIPTRDFRWELTGAEPVDMEFDVSHLVWKASTYRPIFKWMKGADGVEIRNVTLCLDGKPVSRNSARGLSGNTGAVHDNLLELPVSSQQFRRGRWTLRVTLEVIKPFASNRDFKTKPIQCLGIMQFEEGLVSEATARDFVGTWAYTYAGSKYERTFHADGTVSLKINGKPTFAAMSKSHWTVNGGVLSVAIPGIPQKEDHILRDHETLIFIKNPYDNAKRVMVEEK
ncbi:MAG: FecR family protein [Luteolibacter sp.]